MKLDVIFTGVGGQGVVVLSDIFCEAAMLDGFDVTKAEVHGMAQRGGSISAHVRISDRIISPLIEPGKADIILGFELLETARALLMLNPNGTIVVNKKYIPPASVLQGQAIPLQSTDLLALLKQKAKVVHQIGGIDVAQKLGNLLVVNTILLGAVSALPENPITQDSFKQAMINRLKNKYVLLNQQAFQIGFELISKTR